MLGRPPFSPLSFTVQGRAARGFNNNNGVGRRAFVHFSHFTNELLKNTLLNEKRYDICLNGSNIRLIINDNPVPETKLDLNQVAHNTEFIGEEVKLQQEKMDELSNKIENMEKMYTSHIQMLHHEIAQLKSIVYCMQQLPCPPNPNQM